MWKHDTLTETGGVQVRLYFDQPQNMTGDLLVSAFTAGPGVDRALGKFEPAFRNRIKAIHFDQTGAWGQPLQVASKHDFTGWDTTQLHIYAYDYASNTYRLIDNSEYWFDTNGYLHFVTPYAGDIIISEGALALK